MKGKYNMGNWITPLSADVNNNDVAWSVLVGGVAFTIVFAMIGNKILKSEVFMDMLAMTYIIIYLFYSLFKPGSLRRKKEQCGRTSGKTCCR